MLRRCCSFLLFINLLLSTAVFAGDKTTGKDLANLSLPPLAAGTADLSLSEFFKNPIGPLGLEPTEKLLSLANQRVRVVGFMAHEDDPTPGIFMLASHAINVGEKADGMADDLPAATLYVHMPARDADKILSYSPAPWVLTGRLQLGNQEDTNGRISYARLIMEPQDIEAAKKMHQALNPKTPKQQNKKLTVN